MLQNEKFQRATKALLLVGLGLFLYSRIANGTLFFYISERYAWLTVLAVVGLLIVAISYRSNTSHGHDHAHEHDHEHVHEHNHNHGLTWGGIALVALPILLGLLVPPQPLGASALSTREIDVGSVDSMLPGVVRRATEKDPLQRNILDWVMAFRDAPNSGEAFDGAEAEVIGFVYLNAEGADGAFWVARFTVGCCVADASPVALAVDWGQSETLTEGDWVRVRGHFREESGARAPILVAQQIDVVPAPNQPYLYP